MKLGIITPTYNRRNLLERLYDSLLKQANKNFVWLVIDDGSTDDTKKYIKSLNSFFEIRYIKKENAGKVKALNTGFRDNEDIDLFLVVDSDDYLLETAVDTVLEYGNKYINNDKVGALFFRYQFEDGLVLGQEKNTPQNEVILSRIEHDAKYDKVDGSIAYFKKVINKYSYPEFDNENYMGPTVIQLMMSKEFKIVFSPEIVGVAEYQPGGLTASGRKIRIENPRSMIVYCHYMQDPNFNIMTRVKYGIMANAYREFYLKNNQELPKDIKNLRFSFYLRPFGKLLAFIWNHKYL